MGQLWIQTDHGLVKDVPSTIGGAVDLTAQNAAITNLAVFTIPVGAAGLYRVSINAKVTRAAATSSTLAGAAGCQITYTDQDDSTVVTTGALTNTSGSPLTGNSLQTIFSARFNGWIKAGTNILCSFGYTSAGSPAMQYSLHVKVESL